MEHDTICVVDFGGQYAHLIATKLRRLGVRAVIRDPQDPVSAYEGCSGIVLSGSPALASQGEEQDYNKTLYDLPIPVLGLCFGHQEIVQHYGGRVEFRQREYGPAELQLTSDSPIFAGLDRTQQVFMSHGDSVVSIPDGFTELATSRIGASRTHRYAAVADEARQRYGFQFHPEVDDTVHGDEMLRNFAMEICKCRPTWSMEQYLQSQLATIKDQAGERGVFLLASGGVDSTVCAWLLGQAVGPDRLHLLHIDNGMMRLDESAQVMAAFKEHDISRNLHFVDASERFLTALQGVTDPEKKRLIIGNTFIEVCQAEMEKLGLEQFLLAQGTIYPDTIETGGTKRADVIKTHHNRVPMIDELLARGQVIEPIAELYKVEVRELGRKLGVPEAFIARHPFPGPGLGVRCLCTEGAPSDFEPQALRATAAPVGSRYDLDVLPLPVRSVGVKADLRCYQTPLLLHGPDWTWERAAQAAGEIFKVTPDANRCVIAVAPAAPTSARAVAASTTRKRLDALRRADDAVMRGLDRHHLMETIWQCPTVLVPVRLDDTAGELVVVRPVLSERAMTAMPATLPAALLAELEQEILAIDGIGSLAVDLTSKPPGTIEWE